MSELSLSYDSINSNPATSSLLSSLSLALTAITIFSELTLDENELVDETLTENEEIEQEPTYHYETALDEAVCEICAPLEGMTFSESDLFVNFPDADEIMPGALAAHTHSPRDRYCRCKLLADEPFAEFQEDQEFDLEGEILFFNEWAGGGF